MHDDDLKRARKWKIFAWSLRPFDRVMAMWIVCFLRVSFEEFAFLFLPFLLFLAFFFFFFSLSLRLLPFYRKFARESRSCYALDAFFSSSVPFSVCFFIPLFFAFLLPFLLQWRSFAESSSSFVHRRAGFVTNFRLVLFLVLYCMRYARGFVPFCACTSLWYRYFLVEEHLFSKNLP